MPTTEYKNWAKTTYEMCAVSNSRCPVLNDAHVFKLTMVICIIEKRFWEELCLFNNAKDFITKWSEFHLFLKSNWWIRNLNI